MKLVWLLMLLLLPPIDPVQPSEQNVCLLLELVLLDERHVCLNLLWCHQNFIRSSCVICSICIDSRIRRLRSSSASPPTSHASHSRGDCAAGCHHEMLLLLLYQLELLQEVLGVPRPYHGCVLLHGRKGSREGIKGGVSMGWLLLLLLLLLQHRQSGRLLSLLHRNIRPDHIQLRR